MTVAELRALVAAGHPAWDERIGDVTCAAVALAWAARPAFPVQPALDADTIARLSQAQASYRACAVAQSSGEYWAALTPTVRTAWFVLAFRSVAE